MQKTKTLTLDGVEYTVGTIKTKDAQALSNGEGFTQTLVRASILSAGGTITLEEVGDLPFFEVFTPLNQAALEVNGMLPAEAGKEPAEAAAQA
jgi:hypothetical protein